MLLQETTEKSRKIARQRVRPAIEKQKRSRKERKAKEACREQCMGEKIPILVFIYWMIFYFDAHRFLTIFDKFDE